MPSEEIDSYVTLISDLHSLANKIDYVVNYINIYNAYIKRGFLLNDTISFDKNLDELVETLNYKKNKIRNDIIPAIYSQLNNG